VQLLCCGLFGDLFSCQLEPGSLNNPVSLEPIELTALTDAGTGPALRGYSPFAPLNAGCQLEGDLGTSLDRRYRLHDSPSRLSSTQAFCRQGQVLAGLLDRLATWSVRDNNDITQVCLAS
jgi:hypothetical protein